MEVSSPETPLLVLETTGETPVPQDCYELPGMCLVTRWLGRIISRRKGNKGGRP